MRHSNFRGFVTTYDPNAKDKRLIRHFLQPYLLNSPIGWPRICFTFYMPIPKSIRKKDVELYNSGILKHDKKPDVDNLIKLYLDCLDGIILDGDQKVSLGPCIKLYDPNPRTVIQIYETTQKLEPWEVDCVSVGDKPSDIL